MSTRNTDKVKIDPSKLKEKLLDHHISLRMASEQLGCDPSWLLQYTRKNIPFDMKGNLADQLAQMMSCGVQDFTADGETAYSPLIIDHVERLLKEWDSIPPSQYSLCEQVIKHLAQADAQEVVEIRKFINRDKEPAKAVHKVEPLYWFQEYLASKICDDLYGELISYLEKIHNVISEYTLRDTVQRMFKSSMKSYKKDYMPDFDSCNKKVEKYLRDAMLEIEGTFGDLLTDTLKASAELLTKYFILNNEEATEQINAIKERLRNSTDVVPRSNVP